MTSLREFRCVHCGMTADPDRAFCSTACLECERTPHDDTRETCAGLCISGELSKGTEDHLATIEALQKKGKNR